MIVLFKRKVRARPLDSDAFSTYSHSVTRPLALLILLALPASAQDSPGLAAQKAREKVENLPIEARVELKKMYRRYAELVSRKLEAGWSPRVLSEAVIEDVDEPFQPARLVEELLKRRKEDVARIEAAFNKGAGEDPGGTARLRRVLEEKRAELAKLKARDRREKGLCRDWSDQIWHEFVGMKLEHWAPRDDRRSARPFHTSAVACAPADDPSVCLAFDPWEDGRPSVYAYDAWDQNAQGGRFPAEFFLHGLPDKVPEK